MSTLLVLGNSKSVEFMMKLNIDYKFFFKIKRKKGPILKDIGGNY